MPKAIEKLPKELRAKPDNVAFSDAKKVAEHFFGPARQNGSHHVFKMPWAGDPRINLQDAGDRAKRYQVKQLLAAIDTLEAIKLVAATDQPADDEPTQGGKKRKGGKKG